MKIPKNCDLCGKKIDLIDSYKEYDKDGNAILICKKCKKNLDELGPPDSPKNYQDKWSATTVDELTRQRPLGVSILALLQIIGALVMLIIISILPGLFEKVNLNELIGYPLLELLIIIAIITIPITIIIAIGLLNGEKWAKNITILYQSTSVITSIISLNLCGILIPIIIILYLLTDQKVKNYFTKDTKFSKNVKNIIIILSIIVIILNLFIAVSIVNLRIQIQNEIDKPDMTNAEFEEMLIGSWTGDSMYLDEEIDLMIYSDYTCIASYDGKTYSGALKDISEKDVNTVRFNWDEELIVPGPFDDMEGFEYDNSINEGDCSSPCTFMTEAGVIFRKN